MLRSLPEATSAIMQVCSPQRAVEGMARPPPTTSPSRITSEYQAVGLSYWSISTSPSCGMFQPSWSTKNDFRSRRKS